MCSKQVGLYVQGITEGNCDGNHRSQIFTGIFVSVRQWSKPTSVRRRPREVARPASEGPHPQGHRASARPKVGPEGLTHSTPINPRTTLRGFFLSNFALLCALHRAGLKTFSFLTNLVIFLNNKQKL